MKILKYLALFLVVMVVLGKLLFPSAAEPADPPNSALDKGIDLAFRGAEVIKKNLRDPTSLRLASVIIMPSGSVCYEYRAANAFGGLDVKRAILLGGRIQGSTQVWNTECAGHQGTDVSHRVTGMLAL